MTERQWRELAVKGSQQYLMALEVFRKTYAPKPKLGRGYAKRGYRKPMPKPLLDLVEAVARDTRLSLSALRGHSRKTKLVDARMLVTIEARRRGYSLPQIGKALGGRDHTTILNLERRAARMLEYPQG